MNRSGANSGIESQVFGGRPVVKSENQSSLLYHTQRKSNRARAVLLMDLQENWICK